MQPLGETRNLSDCSARSGSLRAPRNDNKTRTHDHAIHDADDPLGYETAPPDVKLDPERVAAMMKYNEALKEAGVLITLDGLHPPSMGARVSFASGKPDGDRRSLHRGQGSARRLLDDRCEVARGGDRLGEALPGLRATRSSKSARCRRCRISPPTCRRRRPDLPNCRASPDVNGR